MKPHLKHIMYSDGKRKCGDAMAYEYVSDEFYRTLPECEKCFVGFVKVKDGEEIPNRLASIERIIVLRDFL